MPNGAAVWYGRMSTFFCEDVGVFLGRHPVKLTGPGAFAQSLILLPRWFPRGLF